MQVAASSEGAAAQKLRGAILSHGKKVRSTHLQRAAMLAGLLPELRNAPRSLAGTPRSTALWQPSLLPSCWASCGPHASARRGPLPISLGPVFPKLAGTLRCGTSPPPPQVLHDALATFVRELRAGGPMRDGAAQPKAGPAQPVDAVAGSSTAGATAAANGSAAAGAAAPAAAEKQEAPEEKRGGSGHSIELKERFFAGASGARAGAVGRGDGRPADPGQISGDPQPPPAHIWHAPQLCRISPFTRQPS